MRTAIVALCLVLTLPLASRAGGEASGVPELARQDGGLMPAPPPEPLPWPRPALVPLLSEYAFASILTMMPGREVYSLFAHTAVRVADPALGIDRTYNYGVFDFQQPGFVLRFLRGRLDYRLAPSTFDRTVAEYHALDRPVIEQRLDLPPADLQRLFLFLETNLLPENAVYQYDFLFDNCSTRPRDALEWALGERLSFDGFAPTPGTFRELIRHYTAPAPFWGFGIELGLGRPVDRTPTPREAMFLPLELFDALAVARLDGRPLVAATDTLFWIEDAGTPAPALPWPVILATLLLLGGVAVTIWPQRLAAAARILDGSLLIFAGLLGLILALMWLATEHHVARQNVDLLWAWPTHLVAAGLLLRRQCPWRGAPAAQVYLALAAAAAAAAGLLGLIGLLAMHHAAVALALVVALRCAVHARPGPIVRAQQARVRRAVA